MYTRVYLLHPKPIGQLKDSSVSFLPSSHLLPSSVIPHYTTPGNYKLVHNNNSHMYLSISVSSLSAVSGVAERLAGVKGQLINGSQFDKSQRLLSSSRAFRGRKEDHRDKCLILVAQREGAKEDKLVSRWACREVWSTGEGRRRMFGGVAEQRQEKEVKDEM